MKKSYLMIAAATVLFVACSETDTFKEDVAGNETELIGFNTYHGKSTRAAVNAQADLTSDNGGFGVYGFKHKNDRTATNGEINLSDTDPDNPANNVNYVTTVFDNVKVWYDASAPTDKFTYAVPKYWDKLKFYTFFAYAPQTVKANGTTKGISFDQTKGLFTRNDIKALQSTNNTTTVTVNSVDRTQYTDSVETSADLIDYLIAPYVPSMKSGSTNQMNKSYTGKELTVGFTFSHILSKLNVYVRAEDQSGTNDHKYRGVQDIKVTKLNIENLPNATTEIATYSQTATNAVAGTWTPANYTTALNIIGGTNALTAGPLWILDGGTGSATSVTSNPTNYIPQEFHYFVAPNTPADDASTANVDESNYILNIDYIITYVDGTQDPFTRTIDLSSQSAAFTKMEQNNIYKIIITIALDQIYFTVDAVNNWANATETEIELDE